MFITGMELKLNLKGRGQVRAGEKKSDTVINNMCYNNCVLCPVDYFSLDPDDPGPSQQLWFILNNIYPRWCGWKSASYF
jgi:hypothetical protein